MSGIIQALPTSGTTTTDPEMDKLMKSITIKKPILTKKEKAKKFLYESSEKKTTSNYINTPIGPIALKDLMA